MSLRLLGVTVSTGRIVDFRLKDLLRKEAERGTVHWSKLNGRKPNAILDDTETIFSGAGLPS